MKLLMTVEWNRKTARTVFAVWIKQVLPGLLFSYLRLTFSGVFLLLFLLFLRSHYLPAG
ncbi:MAG: hypothetical protein HUK14_12365 [Muribaculaceae bacterium]|nr:hypothetical protein [Muribaculaceae bacterium]